MAETILQQKCDEFAVQIYWLNKYLLNKKETSIANQILRSGTSIGANIAETPNAESTEDYIHKVAIARKEANETQYWLRLLFNVNLINEDYFITMRGACTELQKMMAATIKTLKSKNASQDSTSSANN